MPNARDLTQFLAEKFSPPGWVFLPELSDHVGYDYGRKSYLADAVAFCPWPSRGLIVHGFEIKVSRSDWLRELKRPDKADGFGKYCHYWWIVVPERGLIHEGELPDTWGVMYPDGGRLGIGVKAKRQNAMTMDALMLASILRCVSTRYITPARFGDMLRAEFELGKQEAESAELQTRLDKLGANATHTAMLVARAAEQAERRVSQLHLALKYIMKEIEVLRFGRELTPEERAERG